MHISKETRTFDTICLGLICLAGCLRVLEYTAIWRLVPDNVILAIDVTAILIWVENVRLRVVYWKAKQYLSWSAVLMIVLMVNQTMRHLYFMETFYLGRHLWYISCFFISMIALFQFFAMLYIGKNDKEEIDKRWSLLYIPALIFALFIVTNDLHQKVFFFPTGLTGWTERNYRPGWIGGLYFGWITMLTISALLTAFIKCAILKKRRKLWIPLLPVLFGTCYVAALFFSEEIRILSMFRHAFTLPEITCFSFASEIELLILTGIFPSNDRYAELCNMASVGIGIMDHNGKISYMSEKSLPVTAEQVYSAKNEAVMLDEHTALRSHSIRGGVSYRIKDISEINRLTSEISEHVDLLRQENSILDAENQLAEKRIRISEQTKLYDAITSDVCKQAQGLNRLLAEFNSGGDRRRIMAYASVLVAYIKRRANLMILSHQNKLIRTDELALAVGESLEAVRLSGIVCAMDIQRAEKVSSQVALLIYEMVEEVIEAVYADSSAMMIYLSVLSDTVSLRIETDTKRELVLAKTISDKVCALEGTYGIDQENDTAYVLLSLPAGGDAR